MTIRNEREARANVREIRRLYTKIMNEELGRNAGATFAAYDRRVAADRAFYLGREPRTWLARSAAR